ncbi:hypothetical protein O181_048341 [Austropuccinia psidii MF-1]|uniref:Uncharacterized protein n=1 Tax=Austropuccinia psidii MF-1 TaxID=1389203 RepID=A0A9Q3DXU7_9BASI|nr:hypothetical protein [Austropuccinia psidii MF-1]
MSSKLTELTESSLSALPPSALHGSGILSKFSLPSMASSGHFYSTQIYDGYKAVEVLDPACTKSSKVRRYLWSKKDGPFGKEFPVYEAPALDGTSGYSACKQRYLARWTNAGGPILVGGSPIYSSSAKRFQSQVIPSTPRNFQPTLATIPTSIPAASPHSSHTRPVLNRSIRPPPSKNPKTHP